MPTIYQPAPALSDLATLHRPLTPIPLLRPNTPAAALPVPQPASAPAEAASEETPHTDSMPQEAAPEAVRGVVQARVAVKQVGSGIAPVAPNGGGPPVQRKNVTGLPDALKVGVEALSGIAMDDVRVRYNSPKAAAVGALAYAQGREIHIGPGQERHLPHEAWHVVQQKQGRVKPTLMAKGLPINADAALEREADRMGEHAATASHPPTVRAASDSRPGEGSPSVASPLSPSPGAVMQRLMTLASFKETSKSDYTVRYFSSVYPIDTALAAYHALPLENFLARERQLHAIADACDTYLDAAAADDARRAGVRSLLRQTLTEQSYVQLLADSVRAASRGSKVTALMDALDRYVHLLTEGNPPYDAHADLRTTITDRILHTANAMTEDERQGFLLHDLSKLEALARDATLPAITRQIVAEVTANAPSVHFAHSLPGATLSRPGVAEKYTVNHWLSQTGGTAERLGSLAHELTHVSISETFNNTPLFLAFTPESSAEQITALVATRNAATNALQVLLTADRSFTADQTSLIQSKLDYAKGNKLGLYAARYQDAKKITPEQGAKILELAKIANNAVIEYDTVINQMLVYMAHWHIPRENAFYTRLQDVATEAYQYRLAARNRRT